MIVNTYKSINYIKKEKSVKNHICTLCKGENIKNGRCYDCLNNSDYVYYYKRDIEHKEHILNMKFELSSKQKEASLFFLNLYKNRKNGYLKAVCGSGKTEIMYEVIKYALDHNDKVLIAIPRREIVRELKNRLEGVFTNTTIKCLDMNNHDYNADLLISTVNQLINFENEFDLIIVDEVDAYPFNNSEYLHRILYKALKEESSLFYMSATEYNKITYDTFTINRRYHLTDLSMPLFIKSNSPINDKRFTDIISNNSRKYIIYVSSIRKAIALSERLNCDYVSSINKSSSKIIDKFKDSGHLLVSTTLLERGITVNGLDVIIYDSSNEVFTKQVIIQICGRVGRSYEDNKGSIYVFYKYNSLKFKMVKRYIKRMNEM